MSRPKIILSMIVKNEEAVIIRCLTAVSKIIDAWCIVDTGSEDKTPELIENFFKEKGIPGKLHRSGWVDFEYGRQESLNYARELANPEDYCIWVDADEIFTIKKDFKLPSPLNGVYQMEEFRGCRLAKTRLFPIFQFDWWYPVHEVLIFTGNGQHPNTYLIPNCLIDSRFDGARGKDPKRWLRDAEMLEKAIFIREKGELWRGKPLELSRLYFYAANSHSCAGNHELAIEYYRKRIKINFFDEEIFKSKESIGKCMILLKKPREEVVSAFIDAWMFRPTRLEPLALISKFLIDRGDMVQAKLFSTPFLKNPKPPNDILFVETNLYDEGKKIANMLHNPTPSDSIQLAIQHYINKHWSLLLDQLATVKPKELSPVDKFSFYDLQFIAYSNLGRRGESHMMIDKIFELPTKNWLQHIQRICDFCIREKKNIPSHILDIYEGKGVKLIPNSVAFLCFNALGKKWDADIIKEGVPGSEECVIYLSNEMAKEGKKVYVICDPPENSKYREEKSNPRYITELESRTMKFENMIVWRRPHLHPKNALKVVHWAHDLCNDNYYAPSEMETFDGSVWVSDYQLQVAGNHPSFKSKIIPNGFPYEQFINKNVTRDPYKCIYASSYTRGLENLLLVWDKIYKENPKASLDIYYGWESYDGKNTLEWIDRMKKRIDELKDMGVKEHGKVSHEELANAFCRSGFWLYPTNFIETFCITALKAQAGGAIPIFIDIGALKSTVKVGIRAENQESFLTQVIYSMKAVEKSPEVINKIREDSISSAAEFKWSNISKEWISYLNKLKEV